MIGQLRALISAGLLSCLSAAPGYAAAPLDIGALHVFSSATNNDDHHDVSGVARGRFNDSITVNTPGIDYGYLVGSFSIDGYLDGSNFGQGYYSQAYLHITTNVFDLNLNGQLSSDTWFNSYILNDPLVFYEFNSEAVTPLDMQYIYDGNTLVRNMVQFTHEILIPYRSGLPFSFSMELVCEAIATGVSYASCDFSHTAAWTGIHAVTDLQGQSVHGAEVTSVSGFNYVAGYSSTVPEPLIWALWLTGFGAVGVAARIQRPVMLRMPH